MPIPRFDNQIFHFAPPADSIFWIFDYEKMGGFANCRLLRIVQAQISMRSTIQYPDFSRRSHVGWPLSFCLFALVAAGCGTTTQKLATEQLLISDAVDSAIAKIDFSHLSGETVYLDTTYLRAVKGIGFVNSDYIISSLRQQLAAARCLIQDSKEQAEIIIEPRVGALGTDGHEVTYGVPQSTSAIATAAAAISSGPPVSAVPEISIGRSDAQSGVAKVIVFAYERESKQPVWQSGVAKAESTSNSTWWFGAGPFQKGTIHEGFRFAGKRLENSRAITFARPEKKPMEPSNEASFAFNEEHVFKSLPGLPTDADEQTRQADEVGKVVPASHEEEVERD